MKIPYFEKVTMSMKIIKKQYIKPEFEQIKIDSDISLVMTSNETPPGDGFGSTQESATSESVQLDSFSENPFE